MKILCAKFLPDFQNVDTQISKKASCFQIKIFKNVSWGLRCLKMIKTKNFGEKKSKL